MEASDHNDRANVPKNYPSYKIRENSWIARIAAYKLGSKDVAIVIGETIHLHHVSKENFLADKRWVKHEFCHLAQYRKHGVIGFILKYLWESLRKGYHNNRFEVEARAAETL